MNSMLMFEQHMFPVCHNRNAQSSLWQYVLMPFLKRMWEQHSHEVQVNYVFVFFVLWKCGFVYFHMCCRLSRTNILCQQVCGLNLVSSLEESLSCCESPLLSLLRYDSIHGCLFSIPLFCFSVCLVLKRVQSGMPRLKRI